jgi:ABC-type nickel/cobalt efflux system permease component RcnA
MLRIFLYTVILFDLVVLAAKNFAVKNVHLDPAAKQSLDFFNLVSLSILILMALILLFTYLFPRKPKKSNWPHTPPD